MAEKTISYLSTLTREGFAFRVDTRLRPTGSKGPLVQSIDAFKNYYSTQAETWERQALLKARPVAGDRAVGASFCGAIRELIYRETDEVALAKDVRSMREKMEEEVGKTNEDSYNIKQGAGGLVDIEFIVQYLQLLHGHNVQWIRVPGTYDALRAIRKTRLLEQKEFDVLLKAYLFLRQVESRLRIVSNQATSELSRDPKKLQTLARRLGYQDSGEPAGQTLLREYEALSSKVRNIFSNILKIKE